MKKSSHNQLIKIENKHWLLSEPKPKWANDIEDGKVLYFESLPFKINKNEIKLFSPNILKPNTRNISLNLDGSIKGAIGPEEDIEALKKMILRFRSQAKNLIFSAFPEYKPYLKLAPTSFRPLEVSSRVTSWRADDRRLHVDAFPSRPNYGERILRVFINVNTEGAPRVWRVGEPFLNIAKQYIKKIKPYSPFYAKLINLIGVTKSLRSEYDHIMLELHDAMKSDLEYQKKSPQITMPFKPNAVWICFSDQTSHAVMSGQHMMEQTFHLAASKQYDPKKSPLEILRTLTQKKLT
ncbi:MAG: 3-deoxy-D-manno-oct-2-ulosonic acid (Kdo) hydroxylase [Candidatus Methylopumilus sp.]|nr:3-deoxy-D-manno-oct-2-ulosonic acid (Kdo) hydroxylase [Candidatus Methylopumilus sp.]